MTILLSGGGSGGHVTPILAVAHELKRLQSDCRIIYVGERGGKFQSLTDENQSIDEVVTIYAGKFRRYHGESWFKRLIDLPTIFKNIRDALFVVIGFWQSRKILKTVKPDVVFLKGGYVGLPVGLAAASRHIPFVTHDSDALPGLTNRLVARWAAIHATGMPIEFYNYSKDKTRYTGVLVGEMFKPINKTSRNQFRNQLKLPLDNLILLITGGSLGAERLNQAVSRVIPDLLSKYSKLSVIHQVGKGKAGLYGDLTKSDRVLELEFMDGMERYTGAADVVVTRAGANTLAELGVQGKACVVVPNPMLTAGHQLKNAEYLLAHKAILVVDETKFNDSKSLESAIEELLDHPDKRERLSQAIQSLTKPNAAKDLAQLLIETAKTNV